MRPPRPRSSDSPSATARWSTSSARCTRTLARITRPAFAPRAPCLRGACSVASLGDCAGASCGDRRRRSHRLLVRRHCIFIRRRCAPRQRLTRERAANHAHLARHGPRLGGACLHLQLTYRCIVLDSLLVQHRGRDRHHRPLRQRSRCRLCRRRQLFFIDSVLLSQLRRLLPQLL